METVGSPVIDQKRAEHAERIGVDQARIRAYTLDLRWMLEHGTLVDPDVHGVTLFNTRASLSELGIPEGDTRAARLHPGTRELIDEHLTAHFCQIDGNTVTLGFSPELPPPPAFFFTRAANIVEYAILGEIGKRWQTAEVVAVENGPVSRWVTLPDGLDWNPVKFGGQVARWMRLTLDTDKVGQRDLVCNPIKALRSLEVRFRQSLDKYGQSYEGFGGYKWIGFKAYEQWRAEWDRLQAEWAAVKEYVLWRYHEFVDALRTDFEAIACEAWEAMSARHPGGFACMTDGGPMEDLDAFCEYIVERAQERMPSRERIEEMLHVDYRPAMLLGQETVAADLAAAERFQSQVEEERTRQAVTHEEEAAQKRRIWEAERAHQRVVAEEERIARARLDLDGAKLEAMHQAEMEKAREIMASTVSPYQELFDRLRAEMHAGALQVLESLHKNEGLRGKVADKARNMVELSRLMNSHGDGDLEALMEQLSARLPEAGGTSKGGPGNSAIEGSLEEIVEFTRQAALQVAQRTGSAYGFEALEM